MISGVRDDRGFPKARCTCDECGFSLVVAAAQPKRSGEINTGQALRKLQAAGWSLIKKKLRCPDCEARRRNPIHDQQKEGDVAVSETAPDSQVREPSREQKRQIMEMLGVSYDTKAGRFIGGETDATVAAALGGGIMPGWVAAIREDFFGPDGGNDEIEALAGDVAEWLSATKRTAEAADRLRVEFEEIARKVEEAASAGAALLRRLEAIKAAVGPKVARV